MFTHQRQAARVIDKDRDALAILFRRYSRLVLGIALRILGDASEANASPARCFLVRASEGLGLRSQQGVFSLLDWRR